jgi:hypothetical protein
MLSSSALLVSPAGWSVGNKFVDTWLQPAEQLRHEIVGYCGGGCMSVLLAATFVDTLTKHIVIAQSISPIFDVVRDSRQVRDHASTKFDESRQHNAFEFLNIRTHGSRDERVNIPLPDLSARSSRLCAGAYRGV